MARCRTDFPAAAVSKHADEMIKSGGIIEVLSLLYFDIRAKCAGASRRISPPLVSGERRAM
jgi:hypothetical protein